MNFHTLTCTLMAKSERFLRYLENEEVLFPHKQGRTQYQNLDPGFQNEYASLN